MTEKPCQFETVPTGDIGMNSGRLRYRVRCKTCDVVIHDNTTGPVERINMHLREGPGSVA